MNLISWVNKVTKLNKTTMDQFQNNINEAINDSWKKIYPVGITIIMTTETDPNEIFGGAWEYHGEGKVLVGFSANEIEFNTLNKTGGAKTHTLTEAELAEHNHKTAINFGGNETLDFNDGYGFNSVSRYYNKTSSVGGNQPHNNIQPYTVVYFWKRIS